jgi:hypothetical protein
VDVVETDEDDVSSEPWRFHGLEVDHVRVDHVQDVFCRPLELALEAPERHAYSEVQGAESSQFRIVSHLSCGHRDLAAVTS